jgi:hypothetical protein
MVIVEVSAADRKASVPTGTALLQVDRRGALMRQALRAGRASKP